MNNTLEAAVSLPASQESNLVGAFDEAPSRLLEAPEAAQHTERNERDRSLEEEVPPISVRWSVRDVPEAVLSVMSWAWAHDGQVHGVDGRHLRIELPSQHVAAFLRAFSNADDAQEAQALLQAADGPQADAPQDRVVILLELIVPQ